MSSHELLFHDNPDTKSSYVLPVGCFYNFTSIGLSDGLAY